MNWYSPVLFDLNLITTMLFILIPVLSVLLVFFLKRKFLWTAPIISTILAVIISTIVSGPALLTVKEYRAMFFGITVPIQFIIAAVLTGIAYTAANILRQKKRKADKRYR